MIDKILSYVFSTKLTAVLLIIFAAAIGIATFVESMHGIFAAKVFDI